MAERLYHRGLGYQHEAVKIFMPAGAAAPVYAPYIEHYPPDTQAASLWLRNRQPAKWRDRQEVNHIGTLDHRLAAMTPEERLADARAFGERLRQALIEGRRLIAARTIEGEAEKIEEDQSGVVLDPPA
jgi:hypothetical protein